MKGSLQSTLLMGLVACAMSQFNPHDFLKHPGLDFKQSANGIQFQHSVSHATPTPAQQAAPQQMAQQNAMFGQQQFAPQQPAPQQFAPQAQVPPQFQPQQFPQFAPQQAQPAFNGQFFNQQPQQQFAPQPQPQPQFPQFNQQQFSQPMFNQQQPQQQAAPSSFEQMQQMQQMRQLQQLQAMQQQQQQMNQFRPQPQPQPQQQQPAFNNNFFNQQPQQQFAPQIPQPPAFQPQPAPVAPAQNPSFNQQFEFTRNSQAAQPQPQPQAPSAQATSSAASPNQAQPQEPEFTGPPPVGDYQFGYHTGGSKDSKDPNSFREEVRLPDGTVKGAYGYIDADGKQRIVRYTAGKEGFKAEGDIIPQVPADHGAPAAAAPQPQPQPQSQRFVAPSSSNQINSFAGRPLASQRMMSPQQMPFPSMAQQQSQPKPVVLAAQFPFLGENHPFMGAKPGSAFESFMKGFQ